MERKVISTCKKSRNSQWSNGAPRRCTEGMKMVVIHEKVNNKMTSRTVFE